MVQAAGSRFVVLERSDPAEDVIKGPREMLVGSKNRNEIRNRLSSGGRKCGYKDRTTVGKDKVVGSSHGKHTMVADKVAYMASYPNRRSRKDGGEKVVVDRATTILIYDSVGVKVVEHVAAKGSWVMGPCGSLTSGTQI
ncbi:hypothetical protein V6N13_059317 [Hibiscus sabdariffa]|uniref:Uncharacterized protein n=1 Tax=Hibiscus sabdariffa TaxID=183260 RepID=A0ABR2GDT5_9ROSI